MAASSSSQDGTPSKKKTMRMTGDDADDSDSDSCCGMPQHVTHHSQELAVIADEPAVSLALGPGIDPDFPWGRSPAGKRLPVPIASVGGRWGGKESCKGWKKCNCGGHCRNKHQEEWPRTEPHWSFTTVEGKEEMCLYSTWLRAYQRLKPKEDHGSRSQPPHRRNDGGPSPRRSQYARSQSPGPRQRGRSPSRENRGRSSGSGYYNYETFPGWVSRLF